MRSTDRGASSGDPADLPRARTGQFCGRTGQFCGRTRREFLWEAGAGFAGLGLLSLLEKDGFFGRSALASESSAVALGKPHYKPKVKNCIFLFMYGGPSQMDTFDFKPELQKYDGKMAEVELREQIFAQKQLLGSRRTFKRHGQSGQWCSDVFPHLARHMDDIAVIKSLHSDSFIHGSAILQMNTGQVRQGHPSLGSWLTYGLGTASDDLPGFVVMMDPRGGPAVGSPNWGGAYMPARYQGTVLRPAGEPILNLYQPPDVPAEIQRERIRTVNALNAFHRGERPGYSELEARIESYELAYRLQSAAPAALDLNEESAATRKLYGLDEPRPRNSRSLGPRPFGSQCLIARRLVERGVRFVQIYHGGGTQMQNWDAHMGVEDNLKIHGPEVDQPMAALLTDLKQRGLLDETLVVWGGEFGRQPVSQNGGVGRDHNPKGFTYWLAGGGIRAGTSYGETDELGFEATKDRHHIRDLHATLLHLMGIDHERLSYFHSGLDRRLTGVELAHPIEGLLA